MSIKQMTNVFNDETLKGNEKLLMLALADNCNDSGVAFPSWNNIMKKTSMSRGSVAKWIKALEEKRLLFKKSRNRKNGSKTSNKYLIYPHKNKEILDEDDYLIFEDLYNETITTTSSEVELPLVQKLNYPSSEVEPQIGGQSSEVIPLEPSLKYLTINLTITNKKLKREIIEKSKEYSNINLKSFCEWINSKKFKDIAPITKIFNFLTSYDFETQNKIIDTSIMNGWAGLFEPKQHKNNVQRTMSFKQQDKQIAKEKSENIKGLLENGFNPFLQSDWDKLSEYEQKLMQDHQSGVADVQLTR